MTCARLLLLLALALSGCQDRPNVAVDKEEERLNAKRKAEAEAAKAKQAASDKANAAATLSKGERLRGCTTANVQAVVKPAMPQVTRCYRKLLKTQPKALGRLAVEIQIDTSGRAKFLGVKENTFNDESVAKCVFDVLRPLEYPIPDDNACVVVYPFSFVK